MPIQYNWVDPEETIIHIAYPAQWKWNNLYGTQKDINDLLDTSSHSIMTVYDFSRSRRLPPNAIGHMKNLILRLHPAIQVIVFVGTKPFIRAMREVFNILGLDRLVLVRFLFAESVEQGIMIGRQALIEIRQASVDYQHYERLML